MVASALLNAKMFLPGVRRPGIAAIFPSHQGPIVIIDVGANMNAKAEDLYQYGIMGSIYAETILGVTNPRIGLLNVGTEDDKGNELTKIDPRLCIKTARGRPDSWATSRGAIFTKGTCGSSSAKGSSATSCSRPVKEPWSSCSRPSSKSSPG